MNTTQIAWSTFHGTFNRRELLVDTGVKAVDEATAMMIELHGLNSSAQRELAAARADLARLPDAARADALAAGRAGKTVDKKASKKRRADAADRVEDAELDLLASEARLDQADADYRAILGHHAPALEAKARTAAESAILEMTSSVSILRKAEPNLTAALAVLSGMPSIVGRDYFTPKPALARRQPGDDFNDALSPIAHAQQAAGEIVLTIGYAQRVLDDLTADAAEAAAARRQAEKDAAAIAASLEDDEDGDE